MRLQWQKRAFGIGRFASCGTAQCWTQPVVTHEKARWSAFFMREGTLGGIFYLCDTCEDAEKMCETMCEQWVELSERRTASETASKSDH